MNVDGDTLYREFCQRIGEEEGGEALLRYSKAAMVLRGTSLWQFIKAQPLDYTTEYALKLIQGKRSNAVRLASLKAAIIKELHSAYQTHSDPTQCAKDYPCQTGCRESHS